jgi:hypothetical protein
VTTSESVRSNGEVAEETDLLELDDVERRMKPFARRYVGLRPIPLDHVVGTEGRASSFTRTSGRGTSSAAIACARSPRHSSGGSAARAASSK